MLAQNTPAGLYDFGIGWVFPQSNALALQPFANSAGTASALIGFVNGLLSAGMGFLLSLATHSSVLYLATAMLIGALFSSLIYFLFIKSHRL